MTALLAALALQATAAAPLRPGLADLAYALGEAHALRQVCRGRADGYWRTRMTGVLDAEHVDRERRAQLVEHFNAGYSAAGAAHPSCDDASRDALRAALVRAAPLARDLAR